MRKFLFGGVVLSSLTVFAQESLEQIELPTIANGKREINTMPNGVFTLKSMNMNTMYSEFGGFPFGDSVYFCSTKQTSSAFRSFDAKTGMPLYSLYLAKKENLDVWQGERFAESLRNLHVGSVCYTADKSVAFITIDNVKGKSKNGKKKLKIYKATFDKSGKILELEDLPFNSNDYSTGHASLSQDGKVMYFASDRPGGLGGVDLYKVDVLKNGTYGEPINLGAEVNSVGNEMFPWITNENELLFTSDGMDGFGGLDLFIAYNQNGIFGNTTNLGESINSKSDDFAMILNSDSKSGYISSNRAGGKGSDDIYFFTLLKTLKNKVELIGKITDRESGVPLSKMWVSLKDENGNELERAQTDAYGKYVFNVDPDHFYNVSLTEQGSEVANVSVNTNEIGVGETLIKDIAVERESRVNITGVLRDKQTGKAVPNVKGKVIDQNTGKTLSNFVTDNSGAYSSEIRTKKNDPNGSYVIEFENEGYLKTVKPFTNKQIVNGKVDFSKDASVSLTPIKKGDDIAKLINLKPIYFDLGKFEITPSAAVELDRIVKIMNEQVNMEIELGSHTDSRGSSAGNQWLSEERAKASAEYVKSRITNPERVTFKGYGESKLKNKCSDGVKCSELDHSYNRRTEFVILKL